MLGFDGDEPIFFLEDEVRSEGRCAGWRWRACEEGGEERRDLLHKGGDFMKRGVSCQGWKDLSELLSGCKERLDRQA